MKRVIAVVTYEAYVPDDMETSDIHEVFEEAMESKDDIRIHLPDYHDESEAEPLFTYDGLTVGEGITIISS